jgi:hypothetical protein
MKRTPQPELKPFEIRVGMGMPSFGGMYRLGDPARTPPNRFHFLANVRFRDELQERPGTTVKEDSGQSDLEIKNMTQPPKYTDPEEASGKALGGLWIIGNAGIPTGPSQSIQPEDDPWIMRWDTSKFPALTNALAEEAVAIHQIHYTDPNRRRLHANPGGWVYPVSPGWPFTSTPPTDCLNDPEGQEQINNNNAQNYAGVSTVPQPVYIRYQFDDWLVGVVGPKAKAGQPTIVNSNWLVKANFCEDSTKSSGTQLVPSTIVQPNTGIRLLDGGPIEPIERCPIGGGIGPDADVRDFIRHIVVLPARYDNDRTGEVFITDNMVWTTGMGGVYRFDGTSIFEDLAPTPITLGQHPMIGVHADNAIVVFGREGALFKEGFPGAAWQGVTLPAWTAPPGSHVVTPDCANQWMFNNQWGWTVFFAFAWKDEVYFLVRDEGDVLGQCLNPDRLLSLKVMKFNRSTLTLSIVHAPSVGAGFPSSKDWFGVCGDKTYLYYGYESNGSGFGDQLYQAYNGAAYVGRFDGTTWDDTWQRVGGLQSRVPGGLWEIVWAGGLNIVEGVPHVVYNFEDYFPEPTPRDSYFRIDRLNPTSRELRLSYQYPGTAGNVLKRAEMVTEI